MRQIERGISVLGNPNLKLSESSLNDQAINDKASTRLVQQTAQDRAAQFIFDGQDKGR
jgi:hypothetical protein